MISDSAYTIMCPDEVIVGRWYNIRTFSGKASDTTFVKVYSNTNKVFIANDSIYVKYPGLFILEFTDSEGNHCEKSVEAIELKVQEYEELEVCPTSWDELVSLVETANNTGYVRLKFVKSDYTFTIGSDPIELYNSVMIDFNGSSIYLNIEEGVTTYNAFRITGDNCGIKNGYIKLEGTTEANSDSNFIKVVNGKYCEIMNLDFRNMVGKNIIIGEMCDLNTFQPTSTTGMWTVDNYIEGRIADDGIVSQYNENGMFSMNQPQSILETDDNGYAVGHTNMIVPTKVPLYDIAFYDENNTFIEIRKEQQYFKKYYYPEGAKYFRICACFGNALPSNDPINNDCIMRLLGGNSNVNYYPFVQECMIDNIYYFDHQCGGLTIAGACENLHINRLLANGEGTVDILAFNSIDAKNAIIGVTITHSYFGVGTVHINGIYGISYISNISGDIQLYNNVYSASIINSYTYVITLEDITRYCTLINSYYTSITTRGYQTPHLSLNDVGKEVAESDRSAIRTNLAKW